MRLSAGLIAAALAICAMAAVAFADAGQAAAGAKAWRAATTDEQANEALKQLVASDHADAAKFLVNVLRDDTRGTKIRAGWREKVWRALPGFRDESAINALITAFREIDSTEDNERAFDQFELLYALAANTSSDAAAAEVRSALSGAPQWKRIAAVEAVRAAELAHPGSGRRFLDSVAALMSPEAKALHNDAIFTVNVLACLGSLASPEEPANVRKAVAAIVKWQEWSGNKNARLRGMAERALSSLTREDCTLTPETLRFWQWWVAQAAEREGDEPKREKLSSTMVFQKPILGTRTLFVIDVSDSMKWDIAREDRERMEKEIPHLNWRSIRTPLDLAIAELSHALDQLKQPKDPPKPKKDRRTSTEDTDQAYPHFAIITYSHEVKSLTDGWVAATRRNCEQWIRNLRKLEPETTTNIHGALLHAMGQGSRPEPSSRPALDADAVLHGAHTIVFLTDGYATWSNDSTENTATNSFGHRVGNGAHVDSAALSALARKLNRFRHVMINTVGIGPHDEKLMASFAQDSGGSYTNWKCTILYE